MASGRNKEQSIKIRRLEIAVLGWVPFRSASCFLLRRRRAHATHRNPAFPALRRRALFVHHFGSHIQFHSISAVRSIAMWSFWRRYSNSRGMMCYRGCGILEERGYYYIKSFGFSIQMFWKFWNVERRGERIGGVFFRFVGGSVRVIWWWRWVRVDRVVMVGHS